MKVWDVTVLADAAAKGVLPFGLPTEVGIRVVNSNTLPFSLASGRRLLDTQGRSYAVVAGISVPAGGEAVVRALLRAGAYELYFRKDVPARAVISEYVAVTRTFYEGEEIGMVNAVLDKMARDVRSDEFDAPAA